MTMRQHLLPVLLATIALGACGTKGPLILPPVQTATPPASVGNPAQAPAGAVAKDSNTPGDAAR